MSSAKGDELDELVVVEIKKFVWRKRHQGGNYVLLTTTRYVVSGKYLRAFYAYFHLTSETNISQTKTFG